RRSSHSNGAAGTRRSGERKFPPPRKGIPSGQGRRTRSKAVSRADSEIARRAIAILAVEANLAVIGDIEEVFDIGLQLDAIVELETRHQVDQRIAILLEPEGLSGHRVGPLAVGFAAIIHTTAQHER